MVRHLTNASKPTFMEGVSVMIECKLTGKTGKPVKAHIVPKAFYEIPPQEEGMLELLTNSPDVHPKKTPIGIYDNSMVIRKGEDIFSPWDSYASQILLQKFNKLEQITHHNETIAWRLADINYEALKLFALSVLWRAHTSSQPSFSKVKLGKHEPEIKRILLTGRPGEEEYYSVCIARWNEEDFGPVFMDPFRERYDGANFYRIYCGRYLLYIKVDKRKTGPLLRDMQLAPGRDLFIVSRDLRKSKEFPLMKKIARENAR
jgi:hypothetical protein